uniref:Putative secreted protein n=1 Tax=Anopheles darlingi TaxID=43151 RepID=A0A2M4DAR1_ANODA
MSMKPNWSLDIPATLEVVVLVLELITLTTSSLFPKWRYSMVPLPCAYPHRKLVSHLLQVFLEHLRFLVGFHPLWLVLR